MCAISQDRVKPKILTGIRGELLARRFRVAVKADRALRQIQPSGGYITCGRKSDLVITCRPSSNRCYRSQMPKHRELFILLSELRTALITQQRILFRVTSQITPIKCLVFPCHMRNLTRMKLNLVRTKRNCDKESTHIKLLSQK